MAARESLRETSLDTRRIEKKSKRIMAQSMPNISKHLHAHQHEAFEAFSQLLLDLTTRRKTDKYSAEALANGGLVLLYERNAHAH